VNRFSQGLDPGRTADGQPRLLPPLQQEAFNRMGAQVWYMTADNRDFLLAWIPM